MKIIKNTLEDPIRCTCNECQSIFEFNYKDIQRRENTLFFGHTEVKRFIICPVCGYENNYSNRVKALENVVE